MKRIALALVAVLMMLGFSLEGAASPTLSRCRVLVYVSFAFQVAGHTLPAGYYRFEQVLGNNDGFEVLAIRSVDGTFYQAVATKAEKMDDTDSASRIVFRHSGDNLVLAGLCSQRKHAKLALYDAETKQPMTAASVESGDVVVSVPSEGDLLAMARPTR